ncbi:MAG: class I SAM-dependent methyltransferase [Candidatus ainarchaeum sp.]|nr:class I SAM-dependent methyltransferase [Candidatus ainarchaeum sp.]
MVENFTNYGDGYNKNVFDLVPEKSFVLDVGCSTGKLGEKLIKEKKCRVFGVDFSPKAIKIASKRLDKTNFFNLDSEGLPFDNNKFDVIIFADVLEHIKQPDLVLKKFKKILSDDGIVITSIPNIGYVSSRIRHLFGKWDYYETGLMDKTHIRFFTFKTMSELFLNTGYSVIKSDFIPGIGFFEKFNKLIKLRKIICRLYPRLFAIQFIFVIKKG